MRNLTGYDYTNTGITTPTMSATAIKIGCCGFGMAHSKYFEAYSSIEIQKTFYEPPSISTLQKWRAQAPPKFEFTIKAWQVITHEARSPTYKRLHRKLQTRELNQCGAFRSTSIVSEAWLTTLKSAEALGASRILFQCPASFAPTAEHIYNMEKFFSSIERPHHLQLYWEPRGDWPAKTISDLCSTLHLSHAVDPFVNTSVTPENIYFRLHGKTGWRYCYSDEDLEQLKKSVRDCANPYVFFNNISMNIDATRLKRLFFH